jgi:nucleotide-binding universal stress UspA family protein
MMTLRRILFPTDFSRCAEQALLHALYLATKFRAEVHMLHAVVLHGYDPHNPAYTFPEIDEDTLDRLQKATAEHMQTSLQHHETSGLQVKQVQVRGFSAAEVILTYATEQDPDLIVMGTHGRRGLGHLLLGSVAEEVVRFASCPVLTVREQEDELLIDNVNRLLVPIDFSEHSQVAVSYAKELAAFYEAKLQLLHVVEQDIHPHFYGFGKTSMLDLSPDIADTSRQEMIKVFQAAAGPQVPYEVHVGEGRSEGEVVRFAQDHQSDLVVIATHGLTGLQHFKLGSTTTKVVRRAPCPVFTVKAFGKSLLSS